MLKNIFQKFKKEVLGNPAVYILLTAILIGAFFVRVHRASDLMAFHYDQARDALKIWDFWHNGDLFLVGPVTGLAGIFLGPLYYFMIAPFYFLGGGSPLWPGIFLAFLVTAAIFVVYWVGREIHTRQTGFIAAFISAFSYYLVLAGRWLSNPTPIFLSSTILFLALIKLMQGKQKHFWWLTTAVMISASLQFESASAFFYLPILLAFYLWKRDTRPDGKTLIFSGIIFLLSITPQIIFSIYHGNMLLTNFINVFTKENSFRLSFWEVLPTRLDYFWTVFSSKILPTQEEKVRPFLGLSALGLWLWKSSWKKSVLKLFLIFLGVPALGYIFFQGNFGNIYDYYMSGYYLPIIILFSLGLGVLWNKSFYGKIIVGIFFLWFVQVNQTLIRHYLAAGVDGPTHITLGNELQAVNWVFDDARGLDEFNADFYVPPVIPYTYDYLFLWQGKLRQVKKEPGCIGELCGLTKDRQTPIVYVLYEVDPPHPERLENWLAKYESSVIVLSEAQFGGITVKKTRRLM